MANTRNKKKSPSVLSAPMQHTTELIVALDFPRSEKALSLVNELQGLSLIFKVGPELFLNGGTDLLRELAHNKNRIFLDLKFHDIPNTVAKAVQQAALFHVEMFTAHLCGGELMFQAITQALSDIPALRPKILGVSVLTSFDDLHWAKVTQALTGHTTTTASSVLGLVAHAPTWGADGIVCSALELPQIRKLYPSLYTVVPGIRPAGSPTHDQARIVTPAEAHAAGADAIVVGRPITESSNPRKMVESILKDLSPGRSQT